MSAYSKLAGIIGSIFQIDVVNDGPQLKNNSGVLEFRNNADSAFVIARGDDPVGDDDLVTKRYGDANYGGGGGGPANITVIRIPVALVTVSSTATIPTNSRVLETRFEVTTVYPGGTTVDVGDGTTVNLLLANTQIKETKLGVYADQLQDIAWTLGTAVTVTVGGAPGSGAGVCIVKYVQSPAA